MTSLMNVRGVVCAVFVALVCVSLPARQVVSPDAPLPSPSAAVQRLIDQASAQVSKDSGRALASCERALAAARETADRVGLALAHACQAGALAIEHRTRDASAAWIEAEHAWKLVGYGPGQVTALGQQALLEPAGSSASRALLERARELTEREMQWPRVAVNELVLFGPAFLVQNRFDEARLVLEAGVRLSEGLDSPLMPLAVPVRDLAELDLQADHLTTAGAGFRRALDLDLKLAPGSKAVAKDLDGLGHVARLMGQLAVARSLFEEALKIEEEIAPDSVNVGYTLGNLGDVAREQGDLKAARTSLGRGLAIHEKLAPNSLLVAASLTALGQLDRSEGDVRSARERIQRAVSIEERLEPMSPASARAYGSLGFIEASEGNLAAAREFMNRSLAIQTNTQPLDAAVTLDGLGRIAVAQGDQDAARDYHQRALAIRQRVAPNSLAFADSLDNLGILALNEGNLQSALDMFQKELALVHERAAESLTEASALNSLGAVFAELNDRVSASTFLLRSLAIQKRLAPVSIEMAQILGSLGRVAYDSKDLEKAGNYYSQPIGIIELVAPDSLLLAQMFHGLSLVQNARGDTRGAAASSRRAWALVRTHGRLVAGDQAHQAFEASYADIGRNFVNLQVALGDLAGAFATLEEGRAQSLLQLLATRGLAQRLVPHDLWRRYKMAQEASDHAGEVLEEASKAEANARAELDATRAQQMDENLIEQKRESLTVRQARTREAQDAYTRVRILTEDAWTAVRQALGTAIPSPIAVDTARSALSPDTVVAAFAVGSEASTLFLIQHDRPIGAYTLAIPHRVLNARMEFVPSLLPEKHSRRGLKLAWNDSQRIAASRELFQMLFPAQAREIISQARHLLLSPDDVLWELPFAALVTNETGEPTYLGLQTPLSYTPSVSVFTQVSARRRNVFDRRRPHVLAVGNPTLDRSRSAGSKATGELTMLSRPGEIPGPLPYAEREARQIATLYGTHAALGSEPTESWFRQHAPTADIIHLATHGYFNPFRAMSSGLFLAMPAAAADVRDTDRDGALQAWEVMQLRLRADLVVLSACETGVGARIPSEGLIGLTRAFQVAGVSSIVATQWNVADLSTSRAMVAFHQNLRKGLPKDEALRRAMQTLSRNAATERPYYWAPFVLVD